ncbi:MULTISPECIES: glycosyltransferase [unclassified Endozoicomonas]|uniref:glycosyltransferase n=1 Tax=unclassified Endozoicomonas TaxID=2644528 RepID=UPI003BB7DF63
MKFSFSDDSNVTVVITSCGRFSHLKETIKSFLDTNTYPIKRLIVIEDSGSDKITNYIPEEIKPYTDIIINKKKLGQIKSIDKAYSKVDTEYIFHCEDDWRFYRPGYIEDSLQILESNSHVLQVWLRSFYHDISIHSPYHSLGERESIGQNHFYRINSDKKEWQGFSFNPGLRRVSDYRAITAYDNFPSEKALSIHYAAKGYYAVILENDAVLHTGFGQHVEDPREKTKKTKKKLRRQLSYILLSIVCFGLGYILH